MKLARYLAATPASLRQATLKAPKVLKAVSEPQWYCCYRYADYVFTAAGLVYDSYLIA